MKRLAVALALCVCAAPSAHATDWEVDLDLRLLNSDGLKSFLDGGPGELRYGSDKSGLQLGRLRLALSQNFGQLWSLHLDASSWGDHDRNPIDLTEAYLLFRPYPFDGLRARLKAGAFYAPISLENRGPGWDSPYTLTPSAINSWIGEELRTIGVEGQIDWLGTRTGHLLDVALTGAVFGWNEPAGVALANQGFMLEDRQTTLWGDVNRGSSPVRALDVFREIDGKTGVYAGIEARYLDRLVVRALRYDNRGDPTQLDTVSHAFSWLTTFNSVGARLESGAGWTAIAQWLKGETTIEPHGNRLGYPFNARFLLVSKRTGRHTLSARYDKFDVYTSFTLPSGDTYAQYGHAWTVAYLFEPSPHWRFALEWLNVRTESALREQLYGGQDMLTERKIEASFRYALGSAVR
jgi:hypothetical protein